MLNSHARVRRRRACRPGVRGHDHDGGKTFTCTNQRAGLPDRGQVRRGRAFGTAMTASSDETTTITRDGRALPVEIFRPPTAAGPPPWPGVVVIHEIFGVNDDIRRIARRFAGAGALADDLEALLDALAVRPDVARIGVAGFCMGGGFALLLATRARVDVA